MLGESGHSIRTSERRQGIDGSSNGVTVASFLFEVNACDWPRFGGSTDLEPMRGEAAGNSVGHGGVVRMWRAYR